MIEQFLTDTARYADVVLPATTQLEHLDLVPSWGHVYVTFNRPAIEPLGEALPNSEIFRRLARAMGFDEPIFAETDEELCERRSRATGIPGSMGSSASRGRLRRAAPGLAAVRRGWLRHAVGKRLRSARDDPPPGGDPRRGDASRWRC